MKNLYISLAIIIGVVLFVILSSVLVSISIKDIEEEIDEQIGIPVTNEEFKAVEINAERLRDEISKRELLLSILISDTALEDVRNCFADVINYAKAKSTEGVATSGERLHNALESIRVRAEFTVESIF